MFRLLVRLGRLLGAKEKWGTFFILGLMLVGMVLETLGVGLIVPALALLSDPNIVERYPKVALILQKLSPTGWLPSILPTHPFAQPDPAVQVFGGAMIVLVLFFSSKAAFLAYLAWQQTRLVFRAQVALTQELFSIYLRQPYTFHLQRNSAELIRNATTEVGQFAGAFISAINLTTEVLVVTGISVLLVAFQPVGALSVLVLFALAGGIFYRAAKGRAKIWGETRLFHEGKKIQHLQQGLGGVKEVKLLGREEDFLSQFFHHTAGSAKMSERQVIFLALPRLFLEWVAVAGLALLVLSLVLQGRSGAFIIATMGLFGVAAFRVMPSVNRIVSCLQILRFSEPAIETIDDEIRTLRDQAGDLPAAASESDRIGSDWKCLQLRQVGFRYPEAAQPTLEDINLQIGRGLSVGFIGGSGAGKSTLIDLIMGLYLPDTGAVVLDGTDIRTNLRAWQNDIGYVPQTIFLTDDSLRRNVAFGIPEEKIDEEKVRVAIEAAQLVDFVASLPDGLETQVGERGVRISGGQRQRIGIARALYHQPSVLVLDEATSALDIATERNVMNSVQALRFSKTILIVAHRLTTVEKCSLIFRMEGGRIISQETYQEVVS